MPAMMNSTLGDPNLQCGETINFRSSEEHDEQGWVVIRSFMGVVRKHCVLGAECGARQGQREFQGSCWAKT